MKRHPYPVGQTNKIVRVSGCVVATNTTIQIIDQSTINNQQDYRQYQNQHDNEYRACIPFCGPHPIDKCW